MLLYSVLALWFVLVTILGLRKDAEIVSTRWLHISKNKIIKQKDIICKFVAFISMLFLWILTAFRSTSIGNDTSTYINYFYYFSNYGIIEDSRFEMGYQYLNIIIGWISKNPHVFLILISSIMYIGLSHFFFKYSRNLLITITLFFCYGFSLYVNIFRQGLAIIIILYAYQYLKESKKIYALILILIASLFHYSALICLLFFLKSNVFCKRKIVILLCALTALLAVFGFVNNIVEYLFPGYWHYFDSKYANNGWLAVSIALLRNTILYWLVAGIAIGKNNTEDNKIIVMNFFLLLEIGLLGYSVNLFDRLSYYFMVIAIVELPNIIYMNNLKYKRVWMFGICFYSVIMFLLVLLLKPEWNHLYPYSFY